MTRGLSDQEKLVVEKLDSGISVNELAEEMGETKRTIQRIESRARRKLQVKKDEKLQFRLSFEVRELLTKQAKKLGLTESAYLRMLIIKDASKK